MSNPKQILSDDNQTAPIQDGSKLSSEDARMSKITELAQQVIPADRLASFLALPLTSQICGLRVLAKIGGDPKIDVALNAIGRSLNG